MTTDKNAPLASSSGSDIVPSDRLERVKKHLEEAAALGRIIRIYELALQFGLSKFELIRQFSRRFGSSPYEYHQARRACRAREWLREGMREGEIARRIGYRRPVDVRRLLARHPEPTVSAPTG